VLLLFGPVRRRTRNFLLKLGLRGLTFGVSIRILLNELALIYFALELK